MKETRLGKLWDMSFKIQVLIKSDPEVFSSWFDVISEGADVLTDFPTEPSGPGTKLSFTINGMSEIRIMQTAESYLNCLNLGPKLFLYRAINILRVCRKRQTWGFLSQPQLIYCGL